MNVRRHTILTSAFRAFESSDHPASSFLGVIVAALSGVSYIYFVTYISPLTQTIAKDIYHKVSI